MCHINRIQVPILKSYPETVCSLPVSSYLVAHKKSFSPTSFIQHPLDTPTSVVLVALAKGPNTGVVPVSVMLFPLGTGDFGSKYIYDRVEAVVMGLLLNCLYWWWWA
jgi:hypothetical protein